MGFFHKTLLALTLLIASQAKAGFTPESGFWWNPDEPGSGYTIEIQDNYLFIITYVYDSVGNPTWYSAGATMGGNALFDSELDYTFNGTCIDCNYTQPTTVFVELANIRNKNDHRRILRKENRQAVANWLFEGLTR